MKTYAQEVSRLKYLVENNKKNNLKQNLAQEFDDLHLYMENELECILQEKNELNFKKIILDCRISEMEVFLLDIFSLFHAKYKAINELEEKRNKWKIDGYIKSKTVMEAKEKEIMSLQNEIEILSSEINHLEDNPQNEEIIKKKITKLYKYKNIYMKIYISLF